MSNKYKKKQDPADLLDKLFNQSTPDATRDFFLESIAKYCDRCGSAYTRKNIEIVKRAPGQVLLHMKCSKCKATHLASFIKQIGISSRIPFNTDLTIEELKKFSSKNAIDSNDVLDVHDYFNANKSLSADTLLKLFSKAGTRESTKV